MTPTPRSSKRLLKLKTTDSRPEGLRNLQRNGFSKERGRFFVEKGRYFIKKTVFQ